MTRTMSVDEAIKEFQSELKWAELNTYPYVSKQKVEADKMAIKALERESVLDKIREEIEEQVLESLSDCGDGWFAAEKVNNCLEIIDKYKAESGDEE